MRKLSLRVFPDLGQYGEQINMVQAAIKKVLEIASIDFLMVSSIFKKYNEVSPDVSYAEEKDRISLAIRELQYMDAFSQKLNHVIDLHLLLAESRRQLDRAWDHAGFVFKLNYLQIAAATQTFTSVVTDLKRNLHDLHPHIIGITGLDFEESDYFRHTQDVADKMNSTSSLLLEMANERLKAVPLHGEERSDLINISGLYTMDSERYVLLWLLDHPQGTSTELIAQYDADGFSRPEDEIELF